MDLDKLFNPKSIAVVGASHNEDKIGTIIAKNIEDLGFGGELFLVNPKYKKILDRLCHKSLSDIDSSVDLAIIAIPSKFVLDVIEKAAGKTKNFVVISAGFSETGEDGKEREKQLKLLARKYKLNILGPNCLGFINVKRKLNASFAEGLPKEGRISFVSQSGALLVALLDMAKKERFGFSKMISIGNKASIDESSLAEYFEKDRQTEMLVLYLEGIKNGKKFIKTFSQLSQKKPVIVLRAGKSKASQKAIASHTAALTISSKFTPHVLKQLGVIEVASFEEAYDIIKVFDGCQGVKNIAIVTNAGGAGVLATQSYEENGIKLAQISYNSKDELKEVLPAEASVRNPVDLLGDADQERYQEALGILNKDPELDTLHIILTPQYQTPVEDIAYEIAKFKKETDKNIITSFIGNQSTEKAKNILEESGVVNVTFPESVAKALGKLSEWEKIKGKKYEEVAVDSGRKKENDKSLASVSKSLLSYSDACELLSKYQLDPVPAVQLEVGENIEAKKETFSFPCVVKVDDEEFAHKTDQGALVLDIKNFEDLSKTVKEMQEKFSGKKLIVQPMVEKDLELILGAKRDDTFGPIIVFGLGGIYTEQLKLVDYMLPTTNMQWIKDRLLSSKIGFIFKGVRGKRPYNIDEMTEIIAKVSQFIDENEKIGEFDINPLIIYNNSAPASLVDVKVFLKQ